MQTSKSSRYMDLAIAAVTEYYQRDPRLHLSGTGAIAALEDKLARHYGKKYALCCSNATTALLAIALALDLKQEQFITTPLTYGGTLAGWLLLGNQPVFAGVEPVTYTLDPVAVRESITPEVKAILAVDLFGNPCDMQGLRDIADEFGLWYIADAAQSLGACRDRLPASSLADAIVVSFTVGKSLCAGEGGAIITDNAELYQKLVWFTQHPYRQYRDLGLENQFGLNGRMHPLAAAIANATFEQAMQDLQVYQSHCLAIAVALNEIGLTEVMPHSLGYRSTFFNLVSTWRDRPEPELLLRELGDRGFDLEILPLSLCPIPQQAAYVAQYGVSDVAISDYGNSFELRGLDNRVW
ncbi:DegT/DnrJ/EryC1/StrS family aminotransferase [Pseudanabaena sp. FACHB-1277]|uniref:DegT/DnrJ/EryC1/StrS family aminotransferase n=1 Tax=Pseudanabaena cinerea FACHB-1277 TaxID=2949581 RepID=A0A926UUT4_9CYAN|nr:DegT/DnrJ/EryC1/StrS family aminotransferase [Pseudanabaena cinerea]MBD2151123.1 DegT/DnrJ/EryC1/StrS family aminotransferase [Pseudanabaena cinerea FACHB-1277]